MFNKGVEEVVSSDPSSATRTPTSIPVTFQESASRLPTEQEAIQISGDPAKPQVLLPALASDIRSKLATQSSRSVPPPKSGDGTAGSTPSSLEGMD